MKFLTLSGFVATFLSTFLLIANNQAERPQTKIGSTTEGKISVAIISIGIPLEECQALLEELRSCSTNFCALVLEDFFSIKSSLNLSNAPNLLIDVIGDNQPITNSDLKAEFKSLSSQELIELELGIQSVMDSISRLENFNESPFVFVTNDSRNQKDSCGRYTYPRDRYLRFVSGNSSENRYTYYYNAVTSGEGSCESDINFPGQRVVTSKLAVESGNLHVIDDLAFIGYNILMDGYVKQPYSEGIHRMVDKRLSVLECANCNDKQIEKSISEIIGKEIVWVGSEQHMFSGIHDSEFNVPDSVGRSWVPIYHLDLYFLPIDYNESEKTLKYAIADPNQVWQNPNKCNNTYAKGMFKKRISALEQSLLCTEEFINNQLNSKGVEGIPIRIPMYIESEGNFDTGAFEFITASLNGILEDSLYYMPFYEDYGSNEYYKMTFDSAVLRLNELGIKVNPIASTRYNWDSALHCMVYESHRTQ